MMRARLTIAVLLLGAATLPACHRSAADRRQMQQERARLDALAASREVVRVLRTPQDSGRVIYDPPTDLSYANALARRPDLVSADSTRRPPSARLAQPRDTNATEAATLRRRHGGGGAGGVGTNPP